MVIRLDSSFYHDLDALPEEQKSAFKLAHTDGDYNYKDFKDAVLARLIGEFGDSVKAGSKAIKIAGNGSRRNADVIVAFKFRRYRKFISIGNEDFEPGIAFFNAEQKRIANYPEQHADNCTSKHQATKQWFKPVVRIFKNLRARLEADGKLAKGIAPSYYIEGLIYNVPDEMFGNTYHETFEKCLTWLQNADRTKLVCANYQYYLLREDSLVTWEPKNCEAYLKACSEYFNN